MRHATALTSGPVCRRSLTRASNSSRSSGTRRRLMLHLAGGTRAARRPEMGQRQFPAQEQCVNIPRDGGPAHCVDSWAVLAQPARNTALACMLCSSDQHGTSPNLQ